MSKISTFFPRFAIARKFADWFALYASACNLPKSIPLKKSHVEDAFVVGYRYGLGDSLDILKCVESADEAFDRIEGLM